MLSKELSRKVITIGDSYAPPKGGLAQVIYAYSQDVFPDFFCITITHDGNILVKAIVVIKALLRTIWILYFNKTIHIVHIHTASNNSFIRASWFVRLAKMMKRKVVLHVHGGGFKEYYYSNPMWIGKILKQANCILTLTESWNHFFSHDIKLPRVITVPNIIPHPQDTKIIKKDKRIHFLFLGHIVERKGIFDLVKLINEHKDEWDGKLTLHIGGSHEVNRLINYIAEYQLENLICFEGWVTESKKTHLLNLMDVYILPSYVEGMPISILEAFSYGKPVITTYIGGIPEIVNEENGFLFAPGDHNAMYNIICEIIKNPAILTMKAEKARSTVKNNFPEHISEVLEQVYKELL